MPGVEVGGGTAVPGFSCLYPSLGLFLYARVTDEVFTPSLEQDTPRQGRAKLSGGRMDNPAHRPHRREAPDSARLAAFDSILGQSQQTDAQCGERVSWAGMLNNLSRPL